MTNVPRSSLITNGRTRCSPPGISIVVPDCASRLPDPFCSAVQESLAVTDKVNTKGGKKGSVVQFKDSVPIKCVKSAKKDNRKVPEVVVCGSLDLSGRGLSEMPLIKDKNIKELMLKDNKFESVGAFPILPLLERCYLQQNSITVISSDIIRCAKLIVLDLRSNKLDRIPDCLFELQQLEILMLSSNRIDYLSPAVSRLRNLRSLVIDMNCIASIPVTIGDLHNLNSLFIGHNKLEALPEELGNCCSLRNLDVMHNKLTELPDSLGKLENLVRLNIRNNQIRRLPPSIGGLQHLNELFMEHNCLDGLPDRFLCQLRSLDSVNLTRNSFCSFPAADQFQYSQSIDISYNQINAIPLNIFSLAEHLTILNLRGNDISNISSFDISTWQTLTEIDLSSNRIKDLPEEIGMLKNMIKLHLSSNHISRLPRSIGNLTDLLFLELDDNEIDLLPEEIGGLQKLTDLNLTSNKLKYLPETIGNLRALVTLRLAENDLRELPSAMGNMEFLRELILINNVNLDNVPEQLCLCKNLQSIKLENCGLKKFPEPMRSQVHITKLLLYFLGQVHYWKQLSAVEESTT